MKKALRYLLYTLGVLALLAGGFILFVSLRGIPSFKPRTVQLQVNVTPERVAHGQKLTSLICAGCHMDPNTGKLTGHQLKDLPQFGDLYAKNITQHPELGIGKWTDGQLAYLLRTGIKPDGTFLPIMAKLSHMSDEDLHSIIAFLRSDHPWVQADNTRQPQSNYSFLAKFITNIGGISPGTYPEAPVAGPDTTNAVAWGRYLALYQLECYICHSADFAKNNYNEPEKSVGFFGGGNTLLTPDGKTLHSLNITMDEETGIGRWTEEEFIRTVRHGLKEGEPAMRLPMQPYGPITESEARAIFAYLKTVPKIRNKVERKF